MLQRRLLAGVALCSFFSIASAHAQSADLAVATTAASNAATTAESDDIVVFARGQTRQQSTINNDSILLAVPGVSPLKAIERLPGVSFQSADPFGAYEWSARVSLRSFNQNQLGFTLDGVPLGDMSYGNNNGLHISRAAIAENIDRVDVSEGAGALGIASSSNLGGAIEFTQRAPGEEFGADGALTTGSENTLRGFARLDTGELFGANSLRISGSYSYQDADKWKGDGEQFQEQASGNFVQPLEHGEISGFLNWSRRRENDYQDLSLGMIDRLGYDWDNISDNWQRAVDIANIYQGGGSSYPAPIETVDDAYFDASGLRNDTIGALRFKYDLTQSLHVSLQAYRHENVGQGLWYTPYVPTPAGIALTQGGHLITNPAPISIRTTEYDIERYGYIGSATLDLGAHEITAGFWYEDNDFSQARRFYGLSLDRPGRDSLDFQNNPFFTQWEYAFNTETHQYYVQDVWTVTDALTITAGFKSLDVENTDHTIVVDPSVGDINASIEAKDNFLPQIGFTYDLSADHQIFANYAENMRAFTSAATSGPFSTTAAAFDTIKDDLEPETSKTFEAGWRFRFNTLQGSISAYHVDFDNRLLSIPTSNGIVGAFNAVQNVGSVTSNGFEIAANWRFAPDWTLFGSYSYNRSEYQDDYTVVVSGSPVTIETAGKTTVDTPENLARAQLSYDNGSLFGSLSANYTGKRYFTYLNDQSVDSYTLVELTAGYRFQNAAPWLDGTELQLNITNLLDEDYVSTIGSNGFGVAGDAQTLLAGAPRQVFVTLRHHF